MKVLLKKCGVNPDGMCMYIGDLQTVLIKAKIIATVPSVFGWALLVMSHILVVIARPLGAMMCTVQFTLYSSNVLLCNDVNGKVYIIQQ